MTTFDSLAELQTELYGYIERAVTNLNKLGSKKKTRFAIESRIDILEKNWLKFQTQHDQLAVARNEVTRQHQYFKEDLYSKCQETYHDQMATLKEELSSKSNNTSSEAKETGKVSASARALPKIDLPTFSGLYQEWPSFRDLFKSMVHKEKDLEDVQRLQYLRTHVTGEAKQLISNYAVTNENFMPAWRTLEERFENKRLIVSAQLDVIFSQKPMKSESAAELNSLFANIKEALIGLQAAGAPVQHWDWVLNHHIVRLLDASSHMSWEEKLGSCSEPASFAQLESFIKTQIRAREAFASRAGANKPRPSDSIKPTKKGASAKVHVTASASSSCSLCGSDHYISACEEYRGKTIEQRRAIIDNKQLCYNCLGHHQVRNCRSAKRCRVCQQSHHTSIHGTASTTSERSSPTQNPALHPTTQVEGGGAKVVNHAASESAVVAVDNIVTPHQVLLATASVEILISNRPPFVARVLLDQGAEMSFVRESLVQTLKISRQRAPIPLMGIGAQRNHTTKGAVNLTLRSRHDQRSGCSVIAFILPQLTRQIPSRTIASSSWPHIDELKLADPDYARPGKIDIILGSDMYGSLLLGGLKQGPQGAPVAQETIFGWIISGPTASLPTTTRLHQALHVSCEQGDLFSLVERFWKLEEVPKPSSSQLTREEKQCEEHLIKTHSRTSTGRYVVRLPFQERPKSFGDSHAAAFRALQRVHRRGSKDDTFKQLYATFLAEYLSLGHMSRVPMPDKNSEPVYYLPHHGVLRETSSTTRLRVVFNGSQKTSLGVALNQYLLPGPKLQIDLTTALLRWRRYPIVFSADIEKMYRQICVHRDDWDYQRILWSTNAGDAPVPYHLTTVTYGLTSAPYLALRVLKQLAEDEGARYPLAVDMVRSEIYVDDILSGAYTVESARDKIRQIDGLLKAGGFIARKWAATINSVLDPIESSRHGTLVDRSIDETLIHRTLGLRWRIVDDRFVFKGALESRPSQWTKRSALSFIARLFDPLGWLAPIIVMAKIRFQQLWTEELGWDDPLPANIATNWTNYQQELQSIDVSLPRWLGIQSSTDNMEIHGFSDASLDAMGACVYLRVLGEDYDQSRITLISAKTKVAPLKRVTIPRLELSAALLLARLVNSVCSSLEMESVPVHLWTDSTVTLIWIQNNPSRWKDFVANRVTTIQELMPRAQWRHTPGENNPADLASRGISPGTLKSCTLWWQGPPWLSKSSMHWPSAKPAFASQSDLEERKLAVVAMPVSPLTSEWEIIYRYSTLHKLLRVTSYVLRAVASFRHKLPTTTNDISISAKELAAARQVWVKLTQSIAFSEDIARLVKKGEVPKSSTLKTLTPFLDEGILRIGGRLKNATLDYDTRHPAILPRNSRLTHLVVDEAHRRTFHGGVQLTLATIRREFWILCGRVTVKSYIRHCVTCTRQRARTSSQLMGQLPRQRVSPTRPFLNIGVDYAGPFIVKTWRGRSAKTYKAFLIVFVCFATSAIHLELATDYSTSGFLAAYRRFSGRRGVSASITSDCGTNLVGANNELRRLFTAATREFEQLKDQLANLGTQWHFNPPSAPHFGGKWESAVKSVKFHLRRAIGTTLLTYEEFNTLLTQIEGILNSRPLSPLSDDPDDLDALTPGHFLIGEPLNLVPEPALINEPPNRLSRWQLIRQMTEQIWKRWSLEYLQYLQCVNKWQFRDNSIKLGALVLITDERYPPAKWPLARIVKLHPGKDGLTRVVTVRTATSTCILPIAKLCVLPIEPLPPN